MFFFHKEDGCVSMGRNGFAKTTGIDIWCNDKTISIQPITSQGKAQNCLIQFPKMYRDDFIKALRRVK